MTDELMLRVVEVPRGLPTEEVEAILNKPYEDGYYFVHAMEPEPPLAFRAVYKRRSARATERDAAIDFLRTNSDLSVNAAVAHLAARGIVRSKDWVSERKRALAAESD